MDDISCCPPEYILIIRAYVHTVLYQYVQVIIQILAEIHIFVTVTLDACKTHCQEVENNNNLNPRKPKGSSSSAYCPSIKCTFFFISCRTFAPNLPHLDSFFYWTRRENVATIGTQTAMRHRMRVSCQRQQPHA